MNYTIAPDGQSITCNDCGHTSHNPQDVEYRYCGYCHAFLDDARAYEFDCNECGRHIIAICGPRLPTCAACLALPGWFNDPKAARLIDPDYRRQPKALQ